MTIPVIILTDSPQDTRIVGLKRLFVSGEYSVSTIYLKYPNKKTPTDNSGYLWALRQSRTNHPNDPVIIISGDSSSVGTSETLHRVMQTVVSLDRWGIVYLGRSGYHCGEDPVHRPVAGTGAAVVSISSAPEKIQGLLVSPESRDFILDNVESDNSNINYVVEKGIEADIIKAFAISPNLITLDTSKLAGRGHTECYSKYKNDSDCHDSWKSNHHPHHKNKSTGQSIFLVFIIVLAIIFIIAAIWLWSNNRRK